MTFADFEAAIERVVGGLEQRSRVMNAKERQTVAFHECGHALVASLVPSGDPVSKISIIPRSRGALGYTMQMPKEDRYLRLARRARGPDRDHDGRPCRRAADVSARSAPARSTTSSGRRSWRGAWSPSSA